MVQTKLQTIALPNLPELRIQSLLDRNQYDDADGHAQKLGISSALWPLFGLLWPSSLYLALELAHRAHEKKDETVLEIGCGLAVPSLVYHRLGGSITASDCHPMTRSFLHDNLRLNAIAADLPYRHGRWGADPTTAYEAATYSLLTERYDLVVGSDLLYERGVPPLLAQFIAKHTQPCGEAWIIDANRGFRPAFTRHMAEHGFTLYEDRRLNQAPCLSGAKQYKGHLLKFRR